MSNTTRKDKNGKEYKESLKKKDGHFRCRCEHCSGKKDVVEKIAQKEMKEEVRVIEMEENMDFDIPKQDEILEQIFGEKRIKQKRIKTVKYSLTNFDRSNK